MGVTGSIGTATAEVIEHLNSVDPITSGESLLPQHTGTCPNWLALSANAATGLEVLRPKKLSFPTRKVLLDSGRPRCGRLRTGFRSVRTRWSPPRPLTKSMLLSLRLLAVRDSKARSPPSRLASVSRLRTKKLWSSLARLFVNRWQKVELNFYPSTVNIPRFFSALGRNRPTFGG